MLFLIKIKDIHMARKVIDVRIVNAATDGQESAIQELSSELFQNVFPLYFSELEIQRFKKGRIIITKPTLPRNFKRSVSNYGLSANGTYHAVKAAPGI